MQIEKATLTDIHSIERLLYYCVGDSAKREAREYLENENTLTLLAKSNGKDVGFITVLISFDSCDLLDIAVDESYRRKGIGKALFEKMLELTKVKSVILEVRESNTGARKFYERLSFKKISVRKNYYAAPIEDAVIYQREI